MTALLRLAEVNAGYGGVHVLRNVSFEVREREIVALLGANGSGKTTTLRAISGTVPATGAIEFDGSQVVSASPASMAGRGLGHVPEGRGTFIDLTIEENLRVGALARPKHTRHEAADDLERVHAMWPILRDMRKRPAGSLSGGQQQMLALARALLARPRLLLVDEPSLGLAPLTTRDLFANLARLRDEWSLAILLAEQNARLSLKLADRVVVLQRGRIALDAPAAAVAGDSSVLAAYLGDGVSTGGEIP